MPVGKRDAIIPLCGSGKAKGRFCILLQTQNRPLIYSFS